MSHGTFTMHSAHATWGAMALVALAVAGGCAGTMKALSDDGPGPAPTSAHDGRPRSIVGGFVVPALATPSQPTRSTGSVYVRWRAPSALALKGQDLVIVDPGHQRTWRMDAFAGTVTGIAGAPSDSLARVALAPDLSMWVLDGRASRLLRFARDGRLLQTAALSTPLQPAARFAVAQDGSTVLVPAAAPSHWIEVHALSGRVEERSLRSPDGVRLDARVDAVAMVGARVFLLDRSSARVHVSTRDGILTSRVGAGVLRQPFALGADRHGQLYVADAFDASIKVFAVGGALMRTLTRDQLGVTTLTDMAVDDDAMVVCDVATGQVQWLPLSKLEKAP